MALKMQLFVYSFTDVVSSNGQAFQADLTLFFGEHQTHRQILFKARLSDDVSVLLIPMLWFKQQRKLALIEEDFMWTPGNSNSEDL